MPPSASMASVVLETGVSAPRERLSLPCYECHPDVREELRNVIYITNIRINFDTIDLGKIWRLTNLYSVRIG